MAKERIAQMGGQISRAMNSPVGDFHAIAHAHTCHRCKHPRNSAIHKRRCWANPNAVWE